MTPIPRLGLGTSGNTDPEECVQTVIDALTIGYRHIDTAQMYGNEAHVGTGIRQADVPREEVFVATKVHPENLGYADVHKSVEESLDRLGLDYVDLLYVHWPTGAYDPEDTLTAFDELYDAGTIERVGVSNFTPSLLHEALSILDAPLAAHQVERHPKLPQRDLIAEARADDHLLVAYSPLMKGAVAELDVIGDIAEAHGATPAQICLAWHLADEHVAPIPKATGDHVAENYESREVSLSLEDIGRIDAIDARERLVDPEAAAWNR